MPNLVFAHVAVKRGDISLKISMNNIYWSAAVVTIYSELKGHVARINWPSDARAYDAEESTMQCYIQL